MYKFKLKEPNILIDDTYEINCYSNKEICGSITFELHNDVDSLFSEDEQLEIGIDKLPTEQLIYIKYLEVFPKFRRKGIANMLMDKFFNYFYTKDEYNHLMLNAAPFGINNVDNKIDLDILVKFYESKGFEILQDQITNVLLIYHK